MRVEGNWSPGISGQKAQNEQEVKKIFCRKKGKKKKKMEKKE